MNKPKDFSPHELYMKCLNHTPGLKSPTWEAEKKKMLDEKEECPGEKMLFHQFEWEEIFCCSMTVNFVNTLRTFYLIN